MNDEALDFAEKLLERTNQGKVNWRETADEGAFICVLSPDVVFEIRSSRGAIALEMRDEQGSAVFTVKASTPSINTTEEQDNVYYLLAPLHEKARRDALKIDTKLKRASRLLDEL
jgi:hypothetical protein